MAAAAARRFGLEGAAVFVVSDDEGDCTSLVDVIAAVGGRAAFSVGDLRREQAADSAVAACVARFGRVDGVFAVAGGSARLRGDGPVDEASLDGFQAALEVNTWPTFTAGRAAVRAMMSQEPNGAGSRGSILLMSSVLATRPSPDLFGTHGYAAAKGAIESLARTMASTYASHRIRVNAMAPGLVATPMSTRAQEDERTMQYVARRQPLSAGPLPAGDAAAAATFFLSDESRYITGQILAYDGGWSVTEATP
jgi:NAD(P)-dependent dehydrogenase (short-subunit alcohol dehydrogenase family)